MTKSLSNKQQLKAFINVAQYFAGLTSRQNIWEEAAKALIQFFEADFAAFGKCRSDGSFEIEHRAFSEKGKGALARLPEPEILAAVKEVFESGFLTFRSFSSDDPIATVYFPIVHENRMIAVMIVCHLSSASLSKETLDLYLAIAALFAATYSRKASEEEIQKLNMELERRVSERTAQLESVNKELEAFSYSVSHDLRAPLRSISGFSQLLLEDYSGIVDNEGKDYLNRIVAATEKMGFLIDDLIKLSRVSCAAIEQNDVDLGAIAGKIGKKFNSENPERKVEFNINGSLLASGDEQLFTVMLENLLSNAWKFTRKCEKALIEFGVEQQGEDRIFFIKDNGAGFDNTYIDRLFNPFQRLHTTKDYPGTGIGLATVRRIIERHGGRVWIKGELGKGATVFFTFS